MKTQWQPSRGKGAARHQQWPATSDPWSRELTCWLRAGECFGAIDILVNNAAASVLLLPSAVTTAQRNFMFDLNLNVPIARPNRLFGHAQAGRRLILNISSPEPVNSRGTYRDSPTAAHVIAAYGATKAALNRYSTVSRTRPVTASTSIPWLRRISCSLPARSMCAGYRQAQPGYGGAGGDDGGGGTGLCCTVLNGPGLL